jgi:hypothetical protein
MWTGLFLLGLPLQATTEDQLLLLLLSLLLLSLLLLLLLLLRLLVLVVWWMLDGCCKTHQSQGKQKHDRRGIRETQGRRAWQTGWETRRE